MNNMDNVINALSNTDMNSMIEFTGNGFGIDGNVISTGVWNTCWHDWGWTYPSYHYHYETKPNSFELSFKIVSKLLEKKIIQKMTLKQFIETIGEVAKLI